MIILHRVFFPPHCIHVGSAIKVHEIKRELYSHSKVSMEDHRFSCPNSIYRTFMQNMTHAPSNPTCSQHFTLHNTILKQVIFSVSPRKNQYAVHKVLLTILKIQFCAKKSPCKFKCSLHRSVPPAYSKSHTETYVRFDATKSFQNQS